MRVLSKLVIMVAMVTENVAMATIFGIFQITLSPLLYDLEIWYLRHWKAVCELN